MSSGIPMPPAPRADKGGAVVLPNERKNWEKGFERSWMDVEEDEEGNIKTHTERDARLSRIVSSEWLSDLIVADFVRGFFDQNPLSQLGIIITRDGRAEKITDLSGNPK
eukprot:15593-Heterococcus_DN1.PRE.1